MKFHIHPIGIQIVSSLQSSFQPKCPTAPQRGISVFEQPDCLLCCQHESTTVLCLHSQTGSSLGHFVQWKLSLDPDSPWMYLTLHLRTEHIAKVKDKD